MVTNEVGISHDDPEQFLYDKRISIDNFYIKVYEELSQQPYSLHFYLSFSKELIRHAEQLTETMEDCLEIMRRTQKAIKDTDIEMFMYYNPDVALQIVNDLVEEPNKNLNSMGSGASISNTIDKETKNLALRIKKSPSYKYYKQFSTNTGNFKGYQS